VMEGVNVFRFPYFFPYKLERLSGEGIVEKLKKNPLLSLLLPFFFFSQILFTALCIARFKPDHILANWVVPQGLTACLLNAIKCTVPYSVISHGGDAALINKNDFTKHIGRLVLKRASRVVAVSSYIKKRLIEAGMPGKKVNTVSMGVWLSERSIKVNRDIDFVFVGRLEAKKGVKYLIDALHQLHMEGMRFKAVIIGNGSLYNDLSKRVERFGLQNLVCLTGALPQSEVKNILGRSKIFVLPSINLTDDVEGMPTVILEAMSQKAVVLSTDAGGVTDVIKNNINGVLVPQKQPFEIARVLKMLLKNEVLRNYLVKQAYETVKTDYTYDVIAQKLIRIMEGNSHAG
jgi:L-malate glycosyltransferase